MQVMLRTFDELGYRQEQRFHFELGLLKLVHLRRLLPMEELLSQLPVGSGAGEGGRAKIAAAPAGSAPRQVVNGSTARPAMSDPTKAAGSEGRPSLPPAGMADRRQPESAAAAKPAFSPFAADTQRKRFDSEGGAPAAAVAPAVTKTVAPVAVVITAETTTVTPAAMVPAAATPSAPKPVQAEAAPGTSGATPATEKRSEPQGAARSGTIDVQAGAAHAEPVTPSAMFAARGAGEQVGEQTPAPARAASQPVGADSKTVEQSHPAETVEQSHVPEAIAIQPAARSDVADALRQAAIDALLASGKQTSAGEALEDATWRMEEGVLRVQTAFSKTMLRMVLNPDAEKIARAAILRAHSDAGGGSLKIEWLPGTPADKKAAAPKRATRSGSAQAKAEEHPIVRQAQELFQAEIRKVIDLSGK